MYHHKETDTTVATLPSAWRHNGVTVLGLTPGNCAAFGWERLPDPEPEPVEVVLDELLVAKERAFASKLSELAARFGVDLRALDDINIGALLSAASTAGASDADIAAASAILLALAKDVEAESGMNWQDTWAGLKSRLSGYLSGRL